MKKETTTVVSKLTTEQLLSVKVDGFKIEHPEVYARELVSTQILPEKALSIAESGAKGEEGIPHNEKGKSKFWTQIRQIIKRDHFKDS